MSLAIAASPTRRPPPVAPVVFGSCAAASLLFFYGVITRNCSPCAGSWAVLPMGATAIWTLLAVVALRWRLAAAAGALVVALGHAGFALLHWSDMCAFCLLLLVLEIGATAAAFYAGRDRARALLARRSARITLVAVLLAAPVAGAAAGRTILYWKCDRPAVAPVRLEEIERGRAALLFMIPGCPACEETRALLGPRLPRPEIDRCSAVGRVLIRRFEVSTFPSLLLVENGALRLRFTGKEEVVQAVRASRVP